MTKLTRGVLLAGQFRTQHELNKMSPDGQRNTLIVEVAGRSKQTGLMLSTRLCAYTATREPLGLP